MPITVKDLMQSRKELALVSSQYDESVQTALEKMREKGLSQLPVVGSDGRLMGMITSNSILNALQTFGIGMDELRVSHAAEKASTYKEDDELSDVFSDVRRNGAVVVQAKEGQKPIGIITTYDMSEFYSQRAENIILLNNIETTLKEHIRAAFHDQIELSEAIEEVHNRNSQTFEKFKKAIKHYKNLENESGFNEERVMKEVFEKHLSSNKSSKSLDDLTLNDFIELLLHESKRSYCSKTFNNLNNTVIKKLLIEVRDIRNALFHFRREILIDDHRTLRNCSDWLARHPAINQAPILESYSDGLQKQNEDQVVVGQDSNPPDVNSEAITQEVTSVDGGANQQENRYILLAEELQQQANQDSLTYAFKDIERIIEDKLPKAAREERSWWSNDESQSWVGVGWYVLNINMLEEFVTFVRKPYAKEYTEFFQDLLGELSEKAPFRVRFPYQDGRHYITVATILDKGSPVANLSYSFNENHKSFRVELFIDKSDWRKNKQIFDTLKHHDKEIEDALGSQLMWERIDNRPPSRISLRYGDEIVITEGTDELAKLKEWAVDTMIRFQKVMNEYVSKC
jgi:predicted transcriptional regulator/DNA-binding ferritin-like protein (Dps family)